MSDLCESCGDLVLEDGYLCAACLHHCPECLAAMADDWSLT